MEWKVITVMTMAVIGVGEIIGDGILIQTAEFFNYFTVCILPDKDLQNQASSDYDTIGTIY